MSDEFSDYMNYVENNLSNAVRELDLDDDPVRDKVIVEGLSILIYMANCYDREED